MRTPGGTVVHVLVNRFKSQSGGGGPKLKRQATEVRRIVNGLVAQGQHVVVMGDLSEGLKGAGAHAANLSSLYDDKSPLVECYSLAKSAGKRPGTFDSCGWTNQLDPISASEVLASGHSNLESATLNLKSVLGRPLGQPQDRLDKWLTYQEITNSTEQASDHPAVYTDLNI